MREAVLLQTPRRAIGSLVLLVLVVSLGAAPAPAEGEAPTVVDEIVRMLEAEIGEPIVLDWLEADGRSLDRLSADDMIRLKRAGASDELLKGLVTRSAETSTAEATEVSAAKSSGAAVLESEASESEAFEEDASSSEPPPAPPSAPSPLPTEETAPPDSSSSPEVEPDDPAVSSGPALGRVLAPPPPEETAESVGAVAEPVDAAPTSDGVLTEFRLAYSPLVEEDGEPWDLFVYLDGEPLSYVPESTISGPFGGVGEGLTFSLRLPAGEHKLVVLLERHDRRRRGWTHAAKVAPEALEFTLRNGSPAEVEVVFAQTTLRSLDPLTLVVRQEERVVEKEGVGGEPTEWPDLCDDLEGSADADRGHDPSLARRLRGCVSWSDLWTGDAPSRQQILKALERFDFRPIPKGS